MGLLNAARMRAGVLAPAQFAWLKLIDRQLWYALHSLGYETDGIGRYLHPNPRPEAAGARDHWAFERAGRRPNHPAQRRARGRSAAAARAIGGAPWRHLSNPLTIRSCGGHAEGLTEDADWLWGFARDMEGEGCVTWQTRRQPRRHADGCDELRGTGRRERPDLRRQGTLAGAARRNGRLDNRLPLRRRSYRVAKSVLAIGLVAGAFILGQHTRLAPPSGAATSQAANLAAPPPVTTAFPDHVPEAVLEPPPQVPQALARQLAQPPTVVPPPGQAAAVAPGLDRFGLDD